MSSVVTFGEIMLRLKSPGSERLFQSPTLEATFGGGEANVAVSLSCFGRDAEFVSVVPENAVGDAAMAELRKHGVCVKNMKRDKSRLGIYYLETGANQRPSSVVYDRNFSGISLVKPGDFDWKAIFAGAQWFHVTGITPALSSGTADAALEAVVAAQKAGLTVSIDLNYRKKLWNYGRSAPEVMRELAKHAAVIIANEEDVQKCLGIEAEGVDVTSGKLDLSSYQKLCEKVKNEYPAVSIVAITMRESMTADKNGWSAILSGKTGFHTSRRYLIEDIVDRVGGGDSFSAGLIFGLLEFAGDEAAALEYAVAASALKHSISGDFNLSSRKEVEALLAGDGSGRVQR